MSAIDVLWVLAIAGVILFGLAARRSYTTKSSIFDECWEIWMWWHRTHYFSSAQGAVCAYFGWVLFNSQIHPVVNCLGLTLVIYASGCAAYVLGFGLKFGALQAKGQWQSDRQDESPEVAPRHPGRWG